MTSADFSTVWFHHRNFLVRKHENVSEHDFVNFSICLVIQMYRLADRWFIYNIKKDFFAERALFDLELLRELGCMQLNLIMFSVWKLSSNLLTSKSQDVTCFKAPRRIEEKIIKRVVYFPVAKVRSKFSSRQGWRRCDVTFRKLIWYVSFSQGCLGGRFMVSLKQ